MGTLVYPKKPTISARTQTTAEMSMSSKQLRTVSITTELHLLYLHFLTFFIGFKVIGVSPECMDLAAFLTSKEGAPYPCSKNCLQYDNLTAEDTKKLKNTVQRLLE
jgi:hypothetical protein